MSLLADVNPSANLAEMPYQRIKPFPPIGDFDFPELRALSKVWREKKSELEGTPAFSEFIKKLKRDWAIETGIIERLYVLDRGVTEVLIEQGIESAIIASRGGITRDDAEHIKEVIDDHLGVVDGLFAYIKSEEHLTEHFIRGLQEKFTAHQEHTDAVTPEGHSFRVRLLKGQYKSHPNNPRRPGDGLLHQYCPPEFVKEEMESLVATYRAAEELYSPEVKAAWLHHRFTQIHPFQDGNGRVARALATLVFLKDGLFPLVIRDSDRNGYIEALEKADAGDLSPLVDLFAKRQREAILRALGLEQQAQQSKYAEQIISSAMELLKERFSKEEKKFQLVYENADSLLTAAYERFCEVVRGLSKQLSLVTPPGKAPYTAKAGMARNTDPNRHYFQKQIFTIANRFHYFVNSEKQRAWVRMSIVTDQTFEYILSIHGYGSGNTGILAISAFTYLRAPKEDGSTEPVDLRPACVDLFQFNYVEPYASTKKRFEEWLESSILIAMAEWKKTL